ncbi:hypothetical protein HYALB_00012056 [Hymenoscyphus albidus]|uniref:Uncharacterized protein n=1 Tax=Hymenoscyphus albidus TaxID=595503 RepID=A0A9N9LSI9_9HELO|nr:hypothetical protein HYALB_00012056 [Hymenoscyphus albidus]
MALLRRPKKTLWPTEEPTGKHYMKYKALLYCYNNIKAVADKMDTHTFWSILAANRFLYQRAFMVVFEEDYYTDKGWVIRKVLFYGPTELTRAMWISGYCKQDEEMNWDAGLEKLTGLMLRSRAKDKSEDKTMYGWVNIEGYTRLYQIDVGQQKCIDLEDTGGESL